MIEPRPLAPEDQVVAAERLAGEAGELLRRLPLAAPFLEAWPALRATRPAPARALAVVGWLPALTRLAAPATTGLVESLAARADTLEWRQSYTAADFGAGFLERYGWSEFIGLRGPIASTTIACGVLLLGPETDYPPHSHEAEELYVPLAGTALWLRGEDGFVARPPGTPIHHPAWMPHAMRTRSEPLLALYVWRGGDLAAKSKIVGSQARQPR